MTYYGPILPDKITPESQAFGTTAELGMGEAARLSGREAYLDIGRDIEDVAKKAYYSKFDPGKTLSNDEWKKSQYYREGLKVDGDISENIAKTAAQRYDRKQQFATVKANMPKGALQSTLNFTADNIGMALNPIALVGGMGLGALATKAAVGLLGDIVATKAIGAVSAREFAKRAAAGAIKGAGINVGFVAPAIAAGYAADSALDENPDGLQAIASIGLAAGLGAGLGVVAEGVGQVYRSVVSQKALYKARETAINQVAAGKEVEVSPILQNGYREARLKEAPTDVSRGTIEEMHNKASEEHQNISDQIKEKKAQVKELRQATKAQEERAPLDLEEELTEREREKAKVEMPESKVAREALDKAEAELKDLSSLRDQLKEMRETFKGAMALMDNAGGDVLGEEVIAAAEKVNSHEGDATFDIHDDAVRERETPIFDRDISEFVDENKAKIDALKESGKLSKEHLEKLDMLDAIDKDVPKYQKLIRQAAECLKGA
jgi:hypothetical protein